MLARGLVANGAIVFISARKRSECEKTAAALTSMGPGEDTPSDIFYLRTYGTREMVALKMMCTTPHAMSQESATACPQTFPPMLLAASWQLSWLSTPTGLTSW
jgi:hypothetical protein